MGTFDKYGVLLSKLSSRNRRLGGIVRLSLKDIKARLKEQKFKDNLQTLMSNTSIKESPYKKRRSIFIPARRERKMSLSDKPSLVVIQRKLQIRSSQKPLSRKLSISKFKQYRSTIKSPVRTYRKKINLEFFGGHLPNQKTLSKKFRDQLLKIQNGQLSKENKPYIGFISDYRVSSTLRKRINSKKIFEQISKNDSLKKEVNLKGKHLTRSGYKYKKNNNSGRFDWTSFFKDKSSIVGRGGDSNGDEGKKGASLQKNKPQDGYFIPKFLISSSSSDVYRALRRSKDGKEDEVRRVRYNSKSLIAKPLPQSLFFN